ncbi:YdcF family protein [Apilactobacillus apisilvae]|uniref:YdcF family protein n=1 Tax=Apilactobacillus apisilvae TaxID=2923364 RepID=A0ABY4PGL5_9LACO|nr:YdcF family protein [Apilactobacillus apisilvae]UQS84884.1 YdcF family protein [Apilactobacillus apisilvae]
MKINFPIIHIILFIIFDSLFVILATIYFIHAIVLIINGLVVWRRESHQLANIITLTLGLGMIFYPLVNHFIFKLLPDPIDIIIERITEFDLIYIISAFIAFSISVLICNYYKPKLDKDYIIVLGAGLIHGDKVGPILAARIDKAINIYWKQIETSNKHPLIIFSGGQGPDETVPEGFAMCKYATKHGVIENDITAEEQSINTMTNFKLSKKIIERKNFKIDHGIFVSSNYHIYRANKYAKIAGLNIKGIGSKTKLIAFPNAILREFFAILLNHKIFNVLIGILILIITVYLNI